MTRFAVVMRTNLQKGRCSEGFLKDFSDFLTKVLKTEEKNVIIELHADVTLMRSGSLEKAMNIDVHHNSDNINKFTKVEIAEEIAKFINEKLQVPKDRTLVLFFDTRRCS